MEGCFKVHLVGGGDWENLVKWIHAIWTDRAGLKVLRNPDAGSTSRFVAAAHEVLDQMIDAPWSEVLRALETLRYAVGSREWDDEADG